MKNLSMHQPLMREICGHTFLFDLPRAVHKVYGTDLVGIIGFNDNGFVIAKPAEAYSPYLQKCAGTLHKRVSGSCTNLTGGLRKAVEVVKRTPKGRLRRIWLLTDGYPNHETGSIMSVVQKARSAYANVNTIGFGDHYDEALLRRISRATHNGRFVSVRSLRQLTDALILSSDGNQRPTQRRHRAETTVLAIDLSGSMMMPMNGKRKIHVVEEAVLRLLHYKQQLFS